MEKNMKRIIILSAIILIVLLNNNIGLSQSSNLRKNIIKNKEKSVPPDNMLAVPDTSALKKIGKDKKIPYKYSVKQYQRQADIKLQTLDCGDSVVLRWAVSTPGG